MSGSDDMPDPDNPAGKQYATINVYNIVREVQRCSLLIGFFQKFGKVKDAELLKAKKRSHFKAGQVYFEKPKTVEAVLSASNNDLTFRGQVLRVTIDYSQPYRPDTSNRSSTASTYSTAAVSSTHINDLPDDCMMLIFSYFSELQKMQVERVCKNWQRLSRESWRSVKSLCLAKIAPHKKKPKHVDILPSLKRATLALTHLDIGDYSWEQPIDEFYTMISAVRHHSVTSLKAHYILKPFLTPRNIQIIADKMPTLKAIDIAESDNDDKKVGALLNKLPGLSQLGLRGTNVSVKCLKKCKNTITKLEIARCSKISGSSLKGLLAKLDGKLEDLTIDITHVDETNGIECSSLKRLYIEARYGDVESHGIYFNFEGLPSLEELHVERSVHILFVADSLKNIWLSCPNLKKMCIRGPEDEMELEDYDDLLSGTNLKAGLTALSKIETLQYLDISYLPVGYKDEISQLIRLKNLKTLIMRGIRGLVEQPDLIELINSMPSLTYLDCSAAWRDEDNIPLQFFIDRLKKKGQQLELVLGGCCFEYDQKWFNGIKRRKMGRFIVNLENYSILFEDRGFDEDDPYNDYFAMRYFNGDEDFDYGDDYEAFYERFMAM